MTIDYSALQAIPQREEPYHIVVTAAHHDDIEFGVAGSVARWIREEGATRDLHVIITDGGAGSNDPEVSARAIGRAARITSRWKQQLASASMMFAFLAIPTAAWRRRLMFGAISPASSARPSLIASSARTLLQIFVHRGYVNHPDHRAAGEASIYAVFPSSETRPIFPELLAEGFEPHKIGELYLNLTQSPTHYHDISSTIDLKMAALSAHVLPRSAPATTSRTAPRSG